MSADPSVSHHRGLTPSDESQLHLLSVLHYVMGAFTALTSLFGLMYAAMGVAILNGMLDELGPPGGGPGFPSEFGLIVVVIGLVGFVLSLGMAILTLIAARKISRRTGHTLCLVDAGIMCFSFPFGTALGVFTFVVLLRPQVQREFERGPVNGEAGIAFFD